MKHTASVIIFNKDGLILGVSRKDNHEDFGLIGGKLEDYDTDIIEALRRECREETGLELDNIELVHEGECFGYMEHTFKAKGIGEINFDPIKEPHVVKWVVPEVVMDGSFGEYNEKVLALIGIKRRNGIALSKAKLIQFIADKDAVNNAVEDWKVRMHINHEIYEEESSIAKVRNLLSPIVSYFEIHKILDNPPKELCILKQVELTKFMRDQYQYIQNGNIEELLKLIKDDELWN